MAEDEEEMSLEVTRNPMAYDFEPVRRERQVQLVRDLDEPPLILSGVESVGSKQNKYSLLFLTDN